MYSYICYGLGIRSALPLPELERAGSTELGARSTELPTPNTLHLIPTQHRTAQRAGSREQESKEPRAKSEGQEQKTESRKQKAEVGKNNSDCGLRISDCGTNQEETAWSTKPGARSTELPTPNTLHLIPQRAESGESDVEIRFGRVDRLPAGVAVEGSYFRTIPGETQLFWEDVGTIRIKGGREVTIDPLPDVEEPWLRLVILGPVLGALLQQRGHLVLHASAVAIAGGTVAFLGEKGWGKSTVASAFYSRGHGIVSDDVTPVHVGMGCPSVLPGFPQLKLWPDAAVSLGCAPETLPRLHSQLDKRACRVDRGFPQAPLPLKAIYVLAQGNIPKLEPLTFGKAFLELVRHSYRAELLLASEAASNFLQYASIAKSTRIRYLRIPRSLACLPDVARLVEEDIVSPKSSSSGFIVRQYSPTCDSKKKAEYSRAKPQRPPSSGK